MMFRLASAFTLLLASTTLAHAQASADASGSLHLGADLVSGLSGEVVSDLDGYRPRRDLELEPSFGVDLHLDYALSPVFRVGVGQRVLYPIDVKYADEDTGFQADTTLRALVNAPLRRKLDARVRLAAGYSIVTGEETSQGLVLGLGAGVAYQLTSTLGLVGDIGYSWGFQGTSVDVATADGTTSFDLRRSTNQTLVGVGVELAL